MGGVVALEVAHMVEDVVGVVVDVVVEEVEDATRQWVSTLPSLAELPNLAMVGVTAAGEHILSVLAPNLSRRTNLLVVFLPHFQDFISVRERLLPRTIYMKPRRKTVLSFCSYYGERLVLRLFA